MNLSRLSYLFLLFWVCCLTSCSKDDDPEVRKISRFIITLTDITENSASLTITHDGSNQSAYYGFIVIGDQTVASDSLSKFLSQNDVNNLRVNAFYQRKRVVTSIGLIPQTEYTYAVFSLEDERLVKYFYTFTTTESSICFFQEPSWHIEWVGEVLYERDYWTQYNQVVNNDTLNAYYYSTLVSDDLFRQWDGNISRMAFGVLDELHQTVDDPNVDWRTLPCMTKETKEWRMQYPPGDYYAFSIEVSRDGNPTGRYAISDLQHISEYTALESYACFLGQWQLSDVEGQTTNICLKKYVVNKSIAIYGWGGVPWPIIMSYDPRVGICDLPSQIVASDVVLESGKRGFVKLCGWKESENGSSFIVTKEKGDLGFILAPLYDDKVELHGYSSTGDGLFFLITFEDDSHAIYRDSMYKFPISLTRE